MHELGVVFHIIRSLEKVAKENNVSKINSVTLQLGEVSTVIPSYLSSCWKWAAAKNELLKRAELIIEKIDAVTRCDSCGAEYSTVEHGKLCPECGSQETWLLQGMEFLIKEIEAE
ncbi:hydrogenase nickel incorporation protein HypA/HybF [Peptostreptococcaceae bacterium pGA-8]|nr:hydrogenase nickel incorporation protein HypA/HybF [Peptostreptococcaceae bacterium pGA-8]